MRLAAALLVGSAFVATAGCSHSHGSPDAGAGAPVDADFATGAWSSHLLEGTPRPGGQVVVRIPSDPPSLNRLIDSDLWLTRIVKPGIYETLLRVEGSAPDYPLRPALALGLPEVSADHLTYTFKLRPGVRFHNGDSFSARDVVSTFNKLMDPKLRAQSLRSVVADLTSWKALDSLTVAFTFRRASALTLRQLATAIPILPASVLDGLRPEDLNAGAPINRHPIGTGPWRFDSWVTGERIVLVRNPDYWDPARIPHLDRLIFRIVLEPALAYQLLERGELDVLGLTADQWERMGVDPVLEERYRRFRYPTNAPAFIAWNELRPYFTDAHVRRALAELFDQDGFDRAVLHNLEPRADCIFLAGSADCDPSVTPAPYDPVDAATLLDAAGWKRRQPEAPRERDGIVFRFHLIYPAGSGKMERLGPVLEEAYRRAGITMELEPVPWSLMVKRLVDHDFDAAALAMGSADVEIDPYQSWHSSQAQGGSNYISFNDPQADALIDAGRGEMDPLKRAALWRQLSKELDAQSPYLWLTTKPELDAVKRSLRGVRPSIAYYDFAEWWLEPELKSFAESAR